MTKEMWLDPLKEEVPEELIKSVEADFDDELMCSQVTFAYGADKLGFDKEMAILAGSGFGWGMQHGERCGAVTGALMSLGLKYGYRGISEFPNYDILKAKQRLFDERFEKEFGSLTCKGILKANYGIPKEKDVIYEEERYRDCALVAAFACKLLDELLEDDEAPIIRDKALEGKYR